MTCNVEEPQQKYGLGTVSNRLLGSVSVHVCGGINFTGPKPRLVSTVI